MDLEKHQLFVIQPTTLCNLNCSYCWLPDRHIKKNMSQDTFRHILERIGNAADRLQGTPSLVWHGGEPLIMGAEYYRKCLEDLARMCKERAITITPGIQTNCMLIDQSWIDLFKEYNLQIGVSIDGPAFLHDQKRLQRNGQGTHTMVERGIDLLRKAGIDFSVISVITEASLEHADEMFHYMRKICTKSGLGFNIDENEGIHVNSSILSLDKDQNIMYSKLRRFFFRIFELNEDYNRELMMRDFKKFYPFVDKRIRLGEVQNYNSMVSPGAIINIDCEGNFSTFCPELLMGQQQGKDNPFVFGNVRENDFESMSNNEQFLAIAEKIARSREKCLEGCDYFMVCGGGSPSNRYYEHNTLDATGTLFCRNQIQVVADAVLDYVEGRRSGDISC